MASKLGVNCVVGDADNTKSGEQRLRLCMKGDSDTVAKALVRRR